MIKRVLSVFLCISVIWLMLPCTDVSALSSVISAEAVTASAGDTAEVRLMIKDNPGIISLGLDVTYDTGKLKLSECLNGEIFSDGCMTCGNDLAAAPYTILWDDAVASDDGKDGTLAILRFEVLPDAQGSAEIQLHLRASSTVNAELERVPFSVQNGAVQIVERGCLKVGTVQAVSGEQVRIPVSITRNPGITAMRFGIEYDAKQLRLTDKEDTGLLGTAEFSCGNDLNAQPYYFCWDDLGTEDHTENGVLVWLTFEVIADATDQFAPVRLTLDPASTINANLKRQVLRTENGGVSLSGGQSLQIGQVSAEQGKEVAVPVLITEHAGIAALALELHYNTDDLQLTQVENGDAFADAIATFGNDLNAEPYKLMWEDASTKDMTGSGTLAILHFVVAEDAPIGFTPVSAVLLEKSTINEALQRVAFPIIDGGIQIEKKTETTTTTTGTTTITTSTSTTSTTTSTGTTSTTTSTGTTSTTSSTGTTSTTTSTGTTSTTTSTGTTSTTTSTGTTSTTTSTGTTSTTTSTGTTSTTTSTGTTSTTTSTSSSTSTTTTNTTTSTTSFLTTTTTTNTTTTTTSSVTTTTTTNTTTTTTSSVTTTTTTGSSTTSTTTTTTGLSVTTTGTTPSSTSSVTTTSTATSTTTTTSSSTTTTSTTTTTVSTTSTSTSTTTTTTSTSTSTTTTTTATSATTSTTTTTTVTTTSTGSSTTTTSTTTTSTSTTTTTTTTEPIPPQPLDGDFNGDGEVTILDAVLLARFVAEDETLTPEQLDGILNAKPDQDEDELITVSDVVVLLAKLSKVV